MRVLSLNPGLTELAFSLGAGDHLVGRTDECTILEVAQRVPSIGPMADVSEVLVDVFQPELILLGYGQKELAEELGRTYRVVYFEPQSFADLTAGITEIARLMGKQVEAEMLTHEIHQLISTLKERGGKYKPARTYIESGHRPPQAATGYITELVKLAGGIPYAGDVEVEKIQEFDPQFIISCVPLEKEFNFELLTARDGWENLNAVKYERLFLIQGCNLYHAGPRLVEGIKEVAKILHGIDLK